MRKFQDAFMQILLFLVLISNGYARQSNDWQIPLQIQIDSLRFDLYFGIREDASDAFDAAIDTLAPPAGFTPYASFIIPIFPNQLSADFRAPDSGAVWDLQVTNADSKSVLLTWDASLLPESRYLVLNDTLDMISLNSLTFEGNRQITIRYQNLAVSIQRSNEPHYPTDLEIAAYPNPFQDATRIILTRPSSDAGIMYIYNLLGQLVFEKQIPKRQRLLLYWNGRTQTGYRLQSGIYFVVFETQNRRSTQRIVLVTSNFN